MCMCRCMRPCMTESGPFWIDFGPRRGGEKKVTEELKIGVKNRVENLFFGALGGGASLAPSHVFLLIFPEAWWEGGNKKRGPNHVKKRVLGQWLNVFYYFCKKPYDSKPLFLPLLLAVWATHLIKNRYFWFSAFAWKKCKKKKKINSSTFFNICIKNQRFLINLVRTHLPKKGHFGPGRFKQLCQKIQKSWICNKPLKKNRCFKGSLMHDHFLPKK